jgi:hypothetical protein
VVALEKNHVDNKVQAVLEYKSQNHRPYMSEEFIYSWARLCGVKIGASFAEEYEVIRWVLR